MSSALRSLLVLFFVFNGHSVFAANDVWEQRSSVTWASVPLRETISNFAESRDIGFLLDRRVDPGMLFSLEADQATVRDILSQVAEQTRLGYCEIGNVAYLGPQDSAALLPLLVVLQQEQTEKMPTELRRFLTTPIDFQSEYLDTPREILANLLARGTKANLGGTAFEKLPHDLWPKLDFSKMSPVEIFSLILIGFDQMYVISRDGKKIGAIPIPKTSVLTRTYTGKITDKLAAALATNRDAEVIVETSGNEIRIRAPLAKLAQIEAIYRSLLNKQQSVKPLVSTNNQFVAERLANERFTANVTDEPLDAVLLFFANKMQLTLQIDEKSFADHHVRQNTRVTFKLQKATYTEVFEECLKTVNGQFEITHDGTIKVSIP